MEMEYDKIQFYDNLYYMLNIFTGLKVRRVQYVTWGSSLTDQGLVDSFPVQRKITTTVSNRIMIMTRVRARQLHHVLGAAVRDGFEIDYGD